MSTIIQVNIAIYGSLAKKHGGTHVANFNAEIPLGMTKSGLMQHLGIDENERGYIFINGVLSDVPGLVTDSDGPLEDGDHVGVFSHDYHWHYQYRDGIHMSENLTKALQQHGAMHHTYRTDMRDPEQSEGLTTVEDQPL